MSVDEFWAIATARRALALWHRNRGCASAIERVQWWSFRDWATIISTRIDESKKA